MSSILANYGGCSGPNSSASSTSSALCTQSVNVASTSDSVISTGSEVVKATSSTVCTQSVNFSRNVQEATSSLFSGAVFHGPVTIHVNLTKGDEN